VPPIRLVFDATKSIAGGLNKATVRIYNLKPGNRLALAKDAEEVRRIPLSLRVGYNGSLHSIFKGTVHRGSNYRDGPDIVTELECLDGGFVFLNSFTSRTVKGKDRAIDGILSDMPNTAAGKITDQANFTRTKVLVGASAKLIDELLNDGETWYIEDEKLYILKDDEVISDYIPVVNARTGLLGTPTREAMKLTAETLMNPAIKIGGLFQLQSRTAPHLDGVYRVETISYSGDNYGAGWGQTISGFLAGKYRVI